MELWIIVFLIMVNYYTFTHFRDTFSTMWFIGLVFEKTENLNIDLTTDIQVFTAQGNYLLVVIYLFLD